MRKIKTAILVDFMGAGDLGPKEEVENHKIRFTELVKPHELRPYQAHHAGLGIEHGITDNTDLIIFDFGGMMPGSSLGEDNSRAIIEWANEHPSGLVIVVSSFTYDNFIRHEMESLGLNLPNVVLDDDRSKNPIPDWFLL
jgi:hypothetical protein